MKANLGPLLLILLLAPCAVYAEGDAKAGLLKIGYVNFEIAFAQEQEAQKYTAEVEKEERAILEGEQKARTEIEAKMAKFQESMAKLSEKARQDQQTALGNEINALQQQFTQRRSDLDEKRRRILADLENKNRLMVDSLSRKDNYSIVFNSASMVFVSEDIKKNDLTVKLVAEYNKTYPVKPEAPKKAAPPAKKAPVGKKP